MAKSGDTVYGGRGYPCEDKGNVDRLVSAWLIRRFIDPHANFLFQTAGEPIPEGSLSFDTIGGELSHRGEDCTMETMLKRFAIKEPVAWEIARIVHDADLKDGKYGKEEAKWLNLLLKGMQIYRRTTLACLKKVSAYLITYIGL